MVTAPTDLRVTVVDGDQLQVEWADQSGGTDQFRVLLSEEAPGDLTDDGSFAQEGPDLPAGTESFTTSSLLDGERYAVTVEAFDGDGNTARVTL